MKIKNQSDFADFDRRTKCPPLSSNEIEIKNVNEIWDGPLSGTCEWEGELFYFFSFIQPSLGRGDKWPRKYVLVQLDTNQILEKKREDEISKIWKYGHISSAEYSEQYDNYPEITIDETQIVGWFDSGPNDKNKLTKFMESYFEWKKQQNDITGHANQGLAPQ